ncbi:FYN-binding protein 1-like [Stylophora pistillata]|uniref:FYN-binding protein 1-like n=1 Tax=Stylophora pistillata TaxID=50429 RepID=UPI000C045114|nr:FYN-binding protein 1-like [Stylophora pistillata]
MAVQLNEILQKRGSLHRAPPPRAPSNKPPPATRNTPIPNKDTEVNIAQLIPGVKLRRTGMRDSLIAEDADNKHVVDTIEPENELQSVIAKRRALFEQKDEEVKPKKPPKPKPKPSVNNHKQDKENQETKSRSDSACSISSGEDKDVLTDSNRNVVCRDSKGDPKLSNLPTMESLGKPPAKPSKPDSLAKLLEKYDRKSVVMAPRRNTLQSSSATSMGDVIPEENDEGEMYDDVDELKNQILGEQEDKQDKQLAAQEENGIMEENYDDVGGMVENAGSNSERQNPEPILEENYDDLDTVKEQALQIQNGIVIFKKNNSLLKEDEKRREREEKEEKKRKEEEKKKREEEKKKRERIDKELCRKHKLKPGNQNTGVGEAKSNFAGDGKFDLPVKAGETVFVISENNCSQGRWLIKNTEGHYGYIPTELIQLKIDSEGNRMSAIITEDFYEDVDQYQKEGQLIEEEDDQEVYDDIGGQEPIDEDLYEELPADQP